MPEPACLCDVLQAFPTRTRLWLVLHVYEAHKSSNTGVLATRLLPNSRIFLRGEQGAGPTVVPEVGPHAAWLFPAAEALRLDEWKASLPAEASPTLIVPDGTWPQAARARRRIEGLSNLPCVTLPPGEPGRYRLRRASSSDRLATLEAIARAMAILEDSPRLEEELLHVFDTFVERMLLHRGKRTGLSPAAPPPSEDGR